MRWEIFFAVDLLLRLPESLKNAVNRDLLVRIKETSFQRRRPVELQIMSFEQGLPRVNCRGSQYVLGRWRRTWNQ